MTKNKIFILILSVILICTACQTVIGAELSQDTTAQVAVPASLGHKPRAIAWLPDGMAYISGVSIWKDGQKLNIPNEVKDVLVWDDGLWFSTSTPINAFQSAYNIIKYDGEQFEVVYENGNLMDRRDGTTLFTRDGELIWTNGVEERVLNLQRLTTPKIINDHQLLLHQSDRLEVYDVLTHSISQTHPIAIPASSSPVVSPDGQQVAWIETVGDVSTMKSYNFLTGKQMVITDSHEAGLGSNWYRLALAWSPNSDALAFTTNTQGSARVVWIVNFDGAEVVAHAP